MTDLDNLKRMLHEDSFPLFSDDELQAHLDPLMDKDGKIAKSSLYELASRLAMMKAGMPEIKLGDITIKPPTKIFQSLASDYANRYIEALSAEGVKGDFRIVTRYDQR